MKRLDHGDSPLVRVAQAPGRAAAGVVVRRAPRLLIGAALVAWSRRRRAVPFFPRAFLPPFNEGSLVLSLMLNPGTSLPKSNRIGALAEPLIARGARGDAGRPAHRPRRARRARRGRALRRDRRRPRALRARRARRSWPRSARSSPRCRRQVAIGQPISHRLDHLLSGVRAQIALKIFGDDLDTLRGQAEQLRDAAGERSRGSSTCRSRSRC